MTRLTACALGLSLIMLACSNASDASTTLVVPETVPPVATSAQPTTQPPVTPPPTPTSTSSAPTTTTAPPDGAASFAVTQVTFGTLPFVVITNIGSAPGSTVGYWLCQQPGYFELPDVVLETGQRLFVGIENEPTAVGATGTVDAGLALGPVLRESGELGLYEAEGARPAFDDPTRIVDYIEWGRSGHGRSQTAVEAEIWPEGGFVEVASETLALTALVDNAIGPDDWFAEIGG